MDEKRLILVVDDDQSVRRLLKSHLEAGGYEVEVAEDGERGLEKIRALSPSLVILDLLLPGIDGFQVCRSIREDPALSGIRILMLTAVYLSEEDKIKGFRVGADEFLVKPDVILSKPVHLKELSEMVGAFFSEECALPSSQQPADRILVVDDDERNLRLMKMRLSSEGFNVREAMNGQTALQLLEDFQPHLLLLDIKMPMMSGLDVLKEIRSREEDLPVVMMTAYGSEAIAVAAFELGADDYLIKPFDSATASRRLKQLIESHRLRRGQQQLTERLKKISCDLVNRVNYLEVQNQKLEEAYTRVRGLSQFNQRFIRSLGQELRSPLAMILSFTSLLSDTPREKRKPEAEAECLAALFRTAFRLEVNLSNLIYLSRIQADALQVIAGSVDLEPVVEEVLSLVRRALVREDVALVWHRDPENHRVSGDASLLKDLLVNLLDNCIQRTEGPSEIALELLPGGDGSDPALSSAGGWWLRIRDTGANHTDEDLSVSSVMDLNPETVRMGTESVRLNLCRHLAGALEWRLEIANRPTGGGEALLKMRPYDHG